VVITAAGAPVVMTCERVRRSMVCSFMSFFFQRAGCVRDIHSFPTRRSSDLIELVRELMDRSWIKAGLPEWSVAWCDRQPPSGSVDRKSTRLNSSHRTISYAVFCLKKKTTTWHSRAAGGHACRPCDSVRRGVV